jgi:homoserine acetyltransferase
MAQDFKTYPLGDFALQSGLTLDPEKFHIIIPALFGNGESTSPSNWVHKDDASKRFPEVSFYDNVRAQHLLVTEGLGLERARAVVGWSMGAGQTFQWATQFPEFMELCVPFCGSAKTSLHNQVFLEGVKAALLGAKKSSSGGVCRAGHLVEGGDEGHSSAWSEAERRVGLKAL